MGKSEVISNIFSSFKFSLLDEFLRTNGRAQEGDARAVDPSLAEEAEGKEGDARGKMIKRSRDADRMKI